FDISILKLVDGVFEVKAIGGDSALGGDDLDRAIANAVVEWPRARATPEQLRPALAVLLKEARRVKEALTTAPEVVFRAQTALTGPVERTVTRADLAAWAEPLLKICRKACSRVLKDAELTTSDLDGVIL